MIPVMVDIAGPKLQPFTRKPVCPGCGSSDGHGLRPASRFWWRGVHFSLIDVAFCTGGKQPTEMEHPTRSHTFVIGPNGPEVEKEEVVYACAGVDESHLHVKCRVCECSWLMETIIGTYARLKAGEKAGKKRVK